MEQERFPIVINDYFPGNIPKTTRDHHDGLLRNIARSVPETVGKPVLAFYSNNCLSPLMDYKHTEQEIIYLNKKGCYIFLFEPLCLYSNEQKYQLKRNRRRVNNLHNFGFYSEFSDSPKDTDDIRSTELDSIFQYKQNNNLNNIYVYTCDYNMDKFLTYYTDKIDLICYDSFLHSFVLHDNTEIQHLYNQKTLNKKFISTNWRYTSARCAISALLMHHSSSVSWSFKVESKIFMDTPWLKNLPEHSLSNKILSGLEKLNTCVPLTIDLTCSTATDVEQSVGHIYPNHVEEFSVDMNPVSKNRFTMSLLEGYKESFVDVVNESRYAQPTSNLSEKILQSIQHYAPFILVAPPYSLEYLKTFGVKTFDQWWSEEYDLCENHLDRLSKINDVIEEIDSWSSEKVQRVYKEMIPVLKHNFDCLTNIVAAIIEPYHFDPTVDNVQHKSYD